MYMQETEVGGGSFGSGGRAFGGSFGILASSWFTSHTLWLSYPTSPQVQNTGATTHGLSRKQTCSLRVQITLGICDSLSEVGSQDQESKWTRMPLETGEGLWYACFKPVLLPVLDHY